MSHTIDCSLSGIQAKFIDIKIVHANNVILSLCTCYTVSKMALHSHTRDSENAQHNLEIVQNIYITQNNLNLNIDRVKQFPKLTVALKL